MTWVEVLLLVCLAGVIGGLVRRRTRTGRIVVWISLAVMAALISVFGPEFVSDLVRGVGPFAP